MSTTLFILIISSIPLCVMLLYPVYSLLTARLFPHPVKRNPDFAPPVSILISCYNEERYIKERIEALLATDEWIPGSELLITSTGSTDSTNTILLSYSNDERVRVLFEPKITKIQALNKMVPLTKNAFLIFSDCRQYMLPGSVKALLANLNDPTVGTVNCTIMDTNNRSSFYRKLFAFLAKNDSIHGSTLNLYGALYAQRKSVFRSIPEHLLFDDFFVATSTLAQGKRLIQEEKAILYDIPFMEYYHQERIERLARGLLLFVFNNDGLIQQLSFGTKIRFLVYKYLKLILPFCILLFIVACSLLIVGKPLLIYAGMTLLLVIISTFISQQIRKHFVLFLRIQYGFLKAIFGYLFLKRRSKHWQPLSIRRIWFRAH